MDKRCGVQLGEIPRLHDVRFVPKDALARLRVGRFNALLSADGVNLIACRDQSRQEKVPDHAGGTRDDYFLAIVRHNLDKKRFSWIWLTLATKRAHTSTNTAAIKAAGY